MADEPERREHHNDTGGSGGGNAASTSRREPPARRDPWWWVERRVWTEAMWTRLASGESADRVWFALWDKTYAPANLHSAFHKVWQNGGNAGADAQSVAHFARRAEEELQRLHEQLRGGTYRPQPGRRAWIPRATAARRSGRWAFRRCATASCQARCGTFWNRSSRRTSPSTAMASDRGAGPFEISNLKFQIAEAGHHFVVDADLKSYFDTIPHDRLLALVRERVADGRVLALVESFLRAGVLEEAKGWQPTQRGTPQGGVISPLLANLCLNPLDQQMEQAGWAMVRYADDFVILCRSEAEAQQALAEVRQWVSEAGLTLHPEKTRVVNASQPGGFDFLGYHFERGLKWPRAKSLKKLRARVSQQTARTDGRSFEAIVSGVNRALRGWYGYFQHSKGNVFTSVDGYVRRRLRSLLEKRRGHTRQGLGEAHRRWPNAWLARRGLRSLAAEHEWTRTIVRLRTH